MAAAALPVIGTVISSIVDIIKKVVTDKGAAADAIAQLNTLALQGQLNDELVQLQAVTAAQSDINKVEASNGSMFVSGWRPFIGWACGGFLVFQCGIRPAIALGYYLAGHAIPATGLPGIDDSNMWNLLYAMLGMGALRTVDKIKGVASTAITK